MRLRRKNDNKTFLHSPLMRSVALTGCLMIAAVVLINIWTLNKGWQQTVSQTEEMALNQSLALTRQAEDSLLQTEIVLREVQRDIQSRVGAGFENDALSLNMRNLEAHLPQLNGLFYYDTRGRLIATSARQMAADVESVDKDYLALHQRTARDEVHIGAAIRSRSSGERLIPVSMRVNNAAGEFRGIIMATLKAEAFYSFYSYPSPAENDALMMMLADSKVLYARPLPERDIGQDLSSSPLFREILLKTSSGSGQWRAMLDGRMRIFGFTRSARYPLVVATGYDRNTLFWQWLKGRAQEMALNLALLAGIILLGRLVLRQVRRSLRRQQALAAVNQSLKTMALMDGLTGLANRRQFDRYLHQSLEQSRAQSSSVSLILFDIDYFKRYNDTYGHAAGDQCLMAVGSALRDTPLRQTDQIARYGGEEFAIILPDTQEEEALKIAGRVVKAVRDLKIPHKSSDGPGQFVTVSAGVAAIVSTDSQADYTTLIRRADEALYRSKRSGRNQARCDQAVTLSL